VLKGEPETKMAVTRINNNQVTDAQSGNIYVGINAGTKLQNYSITATKIANNLTYDSNLTVTGNLTVQGNTTAIDTTITTIEDPILLLASGQTGSPTVDIGYIGQRGSSENIAFVWDESAGEFITAFTSTAESNTVITITSYANLHSANTVVGGNLTVAGTTSLSGNIISALNVTGNITGGNLLTPGLISSTGTITGGNLSTSGNISAGGTISATGSATVGNLLTGGQVSAAGNITGGNIISGNAVIGNINVSGDITVNSLTSNTFVSASGTVTAGNVATGGTVSATATITGGNLATGGTVSATATITGGNIATGGTVSATGTGTFGNVATGGTASATGTGTFGNVDTGGTVSATGNITGGNLQTGGLITASGNVTGGNIFTGGLVSATGTVIGGNLETGGTANVTGTITGGNIGSLGFLSAVGTATVGNLATAGTVSATGTATLGNVDTGGTVSAVGNVTGANIVTGGLVTASGNVTGGNIFTGGLISATGNITGANVNTAQLYGASGLTITNASGNINIEPAANVVLNDKQILGLALVPVGNTAATSKSYVDNLVTTAISYHEAVVAATNTTLATATGGTISYTQPNGVSNGVGAYIQTTGTFTTIDTANVQTVGTRILVKDEGNAVFNGIYVYSNATAITRSSDADTYGPASANTLSINDYFFVTSGNVNAGSAYIVDSPSGTITFGTSLIQFAQFSQTQVYTEGNGIDINGTVISARVDDNTTAFDGFGNIIVKAGANLTTPNIGAATGTSLSTTGTITGGNLATGGTVSATATITGGNLATGGTASAVGTGTFGNVATAGTVSATGTGTFGNVDTGGTVSATGNVTGANIVTGGLITASGNVTGGNVFTGGLVSATGTVTGGNLETGGTISGTGTITGGNVATGGTVSATGTGTFGNVATGGTVSATGTATVGNLATGGTISSAGNILTGANVSATGNVFAANFFGNISGNLDAPGANTEVIFNDNDVANATSGFTFNKTSNTVTVGANVDAQSFNGNVFSTSVSASGTVTAASTVGGVITGSSASVTGTVTAASTVGGVITGSTASLSGNVTGANLALTTGIIDGPAAGRITINGSDIDTDFAVDGDTLANVFYVDAGTGTASFGSSSQTTNALVAFNTTTSILTPVGNTQQRPATGVTGMFRFNTTNNSLEVYDNTEWTAVGVPEFTVITDQQFSGDGSTVVFTLTANATTGATIVSINGVQQIPTTAYSVSDTTLTFTEAPAPGDAIDVRNLTTTTSVTSISNSSGNAVIAVSDTSATVAITGDLTVTGNATILGNVATDLIQNGSSRIEIPDANGNIHFDVNAANDVLNISQFNSVFSGNIIPAANVTYNLGSTTRRWNDLWLANSTIYMGNAQISANATSLIFTTPQGGQTVFAGSTGGNLTVSSIINANANGVGNIGSSTGYFNTVFAKATSAQYADLAEKYTADANYAPGTVVMFGGSAEITLCVNDGCSRVAGVISTNPSYRMNDGLQSENTAMVALTGRVPTSVTGTVRKGDMMVSAGNGAARAEADPKVGTVIGKALADSEGDAVIEVVVGRV
jgi:fibronectin-binding autotransporter adhesin